MEKEIGELIKGSSESGSRNVLSVLEIRKWLIGYLEMHDKEIQRFPEEAGTSHWNFLSADYDPNRDALFVLVTFSGSNATFAAGRGNGGELRHFGTTDFPDDPNDILPEVNRRFRIFGDPLTVTIEEINRWLGRA